MRILLTNDDGKPDIQDSPYIFGFSQYLKHHIDCDLKVVLPSSQKSWIGKAFQIREVTNGVYYYPQEPWGGGESSSQPRPLKAGECDEWILLDATPATCANVALHNLYPNQIDLVISGPNLGRNTSSAFALSSGTIGAAMSAALSKVRSVALSYGTVIHPTPKTLQVPAHSLACRILERLWSHWNQSNPGYRIGEVDLFNINIPMIPSLLNDESLAVYWTSMWRSGYGRLFKAVTSQEPSRVFDVPAAGPDGDAPGKGTSTADSHASPLTFAFAPEFEGLINPDPSSLPEESDAWAISQGYASVTPLLASFAEPCLAPFRIDSEAGSSITSSTSASKWKL